VLSTILNFCNRSNTLFTLGRENAKRQDEGKVVRNFSRQASGTPIPESDGLEPISLEGLNQFWGLKTNPIVSSLITNFSTQHQVGKKVNYEPRFSRFDALTGLTGTTSSNHEHSSHSDGCHECSGNCPDCLLRQCKLITMSLAGSSGVVIAERAILTPF